jgi:hypothetical protein
MSRVLLANRDIVASQNEFLNQGTVTHYSLLYHFYTALSREKRSKKACRGTKKAKKEENGSPFDELPLSLV